MRDVYCSPEDFGLKAVGDIDTAGAWEFSMLAVWRREVDGVMFWGTDSGCSCPSPFEGVTSTDDLREITDAAAFAREARAWLREGYSVGAEQRDALERIIRKVQRAARKVVAA